MEIKLINRSLITKLSKITQLFYYEFSHYVSKQLYNAYNKKQLIFSLQNKNV